MPSKLTGQIFGKYKLGELLGTGGMSLVYEAQDVDTDRTVAIKIMAPALSNQEGFPERFKEEAATIAKLEHPHIVPMFDHDQHEKYLYLVLRLMPGGSLADRLTTLEKPMPLELVSTIVEQSADALKYAHDQGIIHRDVKPGNILLDDQNNAYLMDFGIAKLITETKGGAMSALLGTPAYIAPEQWQAHIIDHRVDIYSLAVVVYRLLTGNLPFTSGSPFYLMYSHLHGETPKISDQLDNIPAELDTVMGKALAKRPEDRYDDVTQFAKEFRSAVTTQESDDKSTTEVLLDVSGRRSFRPDTKRDDRLDKLWIALERGSGNIYVTPDVEDLFGPGGEERRTAKMEDIWDELEGPPTAVYNTRKLQELLEQLKRDQAFLGVKTQRVRLPENIAEELDREAGLLVIAVEPSSPAAESGLYLGDLLISLDENVLQHQDDLINLLNDDRIDRTVNLGFIRTGETKSAEIKLVKRLGGKSTV